MPTPRVILLACSLAGAACATDPSDDVAALDGDLAAGAPRACSAAKLAELVAPATAAAPLARVDCTATLPAGAVVTKRLLFEGPAATGQSLDCAGGLVNGAAGTLNAGGTMIEIRSLKTVDAVTGAASWQPPSAITVQNCRVVGGIRIWGMATNGQGADLRASSRLPGHTARARANAPHDIHLRNLHVTSSGPTPLYVSPGTSGVMVEGSTLDGASHGLAVYFDTESTGNTLRANTIAADTSASGREQIAIDGSTNNTIVNNHFSSLSNGGIYLYRNCGEGGTIRISTPSNNAIINNTFFYAHYTGPNPSVWLGSRDGSGPPFFASYCGDDAGFPFGSSASDLDHATNNGVLGNKIFVRTVSDMILTRDLDVNSPNVVGGNVTVTAAPAPQPAGCFVVNGYGDKFLLDGQATEILLGADGQPTCDGHRYTCHDGALTATPVAGQACAFTAVPYDCAVSGSNSGCTKTVACPAGKKLVGGYGACNLETTGLTAPTPSNQLVVATPSDITSDGHCILDGHDLSHGRGFVTGLTGKASVTVGCREFDLLGGDCHIAGALYCR
jgi:parallel beta-helix repeat protein